MGEVVVQRDESNRILGLTSKDMGEGTLANMSAMHFLRAAVASMTEYLHVSPGFSVGEEISLEVKRSDLHLNREIDAIMETLVIGLKLLAKEYPDDLVVQEATVEIQV